VNEQDDKGYTALHHAISSKDVHKARMLIQHGVDTKITTYSLLTAYDLASSSQLKRLLDDNLPSENSKESNESNLHSQVTNKENKLIDKLNNLKSNFFFLIFNFQAIWEIQKDSTIIRNRGLNHQILHFTLI
jgi:ankyrin repeat protein